MLLVRRITIAVVATAAVSAAFAATYVVRPDGTGDFPTIAAAIEAAEGGDVIELADGIFQGPGNRDLTVEKLVAIRSESGDPSTCLVDCEGSAEEAHLWLFLDSNSLVEGVTAFGAYSEGGYGAVCVTSDGIVRNCVFRGNESPSRGAAAFCQLNAVFDHCWFTENLGGGAVRVGGESHPRFQSCYFVNNEGIACFAEGGVDLVDCVFSGGSLGGYCALSVVWDYDLRMTGCTVLGFAPPPPGRATIGVYQGRLRIENTVIAFNRGAATFDCAGTITTLCSDVWGNEGGDWVGCIEGQLGQDGNICLDPQFCSEDPSEDEDWSIQSDSPCALTQSPCGLIGAQDAGCGSAAVEERTWGGVKLLFSR